MKRVLLLLVVSAGLMLGSCASSGSAAAGKCPKCGGPLTSANYCEHCHEYAATPPSK